VQQSSDTTGPDDAEVPTDIAMPANIMRGGCVGFFSRCVLHGNSGVRAGGVGLNAGTLSFFSSVFSSNVATLYGGAIELAPSVVFSRLSAAQSTHRLESAVMMSDCTLRDNLVMGVSSSPGQGGGLYFHRGGRAAFYNSIFERNGASSEHSAGGLFSFYQGGALYLRDSVVVNSTATYGGVIRLHATSLSNISALFDNVTFGGNEGRRFGGVLSAYTYDHSKFVHFSYNGDEFMYDLDPNDFRSRPLLRFGFQGNPYENPYEATIKPHGHRSDHFNPFEEPHYARELPLDPHSTHQWPFVARDESTLIGQKAASGGVAFLTEGGGCAFKDCKFVDNRPVPQVACYYHEELEIHQCLPATRLY